MESFPPPPPPPPPSPTAWSGGPGTPPTSLAFDPPERIANWRPLVQWLLAIPHLVILYALQIVSEVVSVVAWFVILFTGRLPEGMATLQTMYLRYQQRVTFYSGFLLSEYPPFSFDLAATDPGDHPRLRVDFNPQLENRNRLTVGFRFILLIPLFLWLMILGIAVFFVYVVAFFAVLFTGRWPQGMQEFVVKFVRYSLRIASYGVLLDDQWPGFNLD
jgi:Domain of unknown function (DUF4389)